MKLRRIAFLLLFIAGSLPLRSARAANPIGMQVESPLALVEKPLQIAVRSGHWIPLAITLTNSGDDVHGTLTAHLMSSNGFDRNPNDYYTEVELPTNSRKRVWLYVRMDRDEADGCEVLLRGRGIRPLKMVAPISAPEPSTRLVLTISDSGEKLSYLSGMKSSTLAYPVEPPPSYSPYGGYVPPVAPIPNSNPLRPMGAIHEMVPSRWVGFDALDLLVLKDFDHKTLTPDQIQAVRSYAAAGGTVLAFGGADWQRLIASPFADLWPLQPNGATPATAAEIDTLVQRFFRSRYPSAAATGGDKLGGAAALLARGSLRQSAQVLVGTGSTPLLSRLDYGAGRFLLLAVDPTQPPFLGWRGLEGLWTTIINQTGRPRIIEEVNPLVVMTGYSTNNYARYGGYPGYGDDDSRGSATQHLLSVINKSPELRTPPVSFIAWFLALYVFFLVPVNYSVLRFFDKRELAWVTVPVIVIAFSVMSYAAALSIKGRVVRTRQVTIVQGAQDTGQARADTMLWLFSPRKTAYEMVSDEPQMVVADYLKNRENSVTLHEPAEQAPIAIDDAGVLMWSSRSFVAHGVVNAGNGIHIGLQGSQPVVQNKTSFDMRGVVLVIGGRLYPLQDLKAGATATLTKNDGIVGTDNLPGRIMGASHVDQLLKGETSYGDIASNALSVALGSRSSDRPSIFLVGWSDRSFAPIKAKGESPREQSLTLFLFRCPNDLQLQQAMAGLQKSGAVDAGVRLVAQEELPAKDSSVKRNRNRYYGYGNQYAGPGKKFTYECTLPGAGKRQSWTNLKLQFAGTGRYRSDNDDEGSPPPAPPGAPPQPGGREVRNVAPIAAQIWDESASAWKSLALDFGKDKNANNWSVEVKLPADAATRYLRASDNTAIVAVNTASGNVAVNSLHLQAMLTR